MNSLVVFFEIPANDFDRAVAFHGTVLGVKLSVSLAKDFRPSKDGVLISLHVDDMEKALSAVKANGGKIIRPKTGIEAEEHGYFALFTDSEGNRLELCSGK
ncbi:MAG: VOC family protein [Prevotellaceae bacterium]|jgi:predicted enzyme related to lactoylglutathione lyase|nr:VOC family protein [Prevotellaceae bacterium]